MEQPHYLGKWKGSSLGRRCRGSFRQEHYLWLRRKPHLQICV